LNLIRLTFLYWINKPFSTALQSLLMAVPVALLISVFIINRQINSKLLKHIESVDLILSAPGNPMEITNGGLLFSGDPSGTISIREVYEIVKNRVVRLAIPLILGDYYRDARLIGTNHNYLTVQNADLKDGRLWEKAMEIVPGHIAARKLNLEVGDKITIERNHNNINKPDLVFYYVVGVLEKTGTALDRVILTSLESLQMHETGLEEQGTGDQKSLSGEKGYNIFPFEFPDNPDLNLSYVLIQYRSPMAAMTYPKYVKRVSAIQPVAPGVEVLHLKNITSHALRYFIVLAFIFIGISGLSLILFFNNFLQNNESNFAIFRAMGCNRHTIVLLMVLMAMLIADAGAITGIILGHIGAHYAAGSVPFLKMAGITGWTFYGFEIVIYLLCHLILILMSSFSTYRIYNLDLKKVLL